MTPLAALRSAPIACGVADSDPESSMPRNVRVKNRIWWEFTDIAGERGKSQWVSPFIESVVKAPQRWREFRAVAEIRGDTIADALVKAITLYRDAE